MRHALGIAIAIVVVTAAPRIARAGAWYYTWSCSGECAPGQLAIKGYEGPFASEDECNSVRNADTRRDSFVAQGNLGGLDFCRESDGPPSVDDSGTTAGPPTVTARFLLALVAGPSYRVEDATAIETTTGGTGGLELGLHIGGHPTFGIETSLGLHYTEMTADHYGPNAKPMMFVPYLIGFTSTPAIIRGKATEVRLDLGVDGGLLFLAGCANCDADMLPSLGFIGQLRAGIDTYFGMQKTGGIGLDAIFMFGQLGDPHDPITPSAVAILPPTVLFRVSLIARNNRGVAW
jgi:hypothetical protein